MPVLWNSIPYPIKTKEDHKKLLVLLRKKLETYNSAPLQPNVKLITLRASQLRFSDSPIYKLPVTDSAHRILPEDLQHYLPRPRLDIPHSHSPGIRIKLLAPISRTFNVKAQVWRVMAFGQIACLKIFQTCLIGFEPEWFTNHKICEAFFPEEEQAHMEAWTYSKLKPLQGTFLPHSYGFYDVGH